MLINRKVYPIDYPAHIEEWRLLMEMEFDKIYGTDKALQMICSQADCLIDQAREVLTLNR